MGIKIEDLYGGGVTGNLLRPEYTFHPKVLAALQKRHRGPQGFIDEDGCYDGWKVPYGVRYARLKPLVASQLSQKYPWYVTWYSPTKGKRLKRFCMSLPSAIAFAARAAKVDPGVTIVNRLGMDIPPKLRNKLPAPWKWCPCCMKPRKYRRQYSLMGKPITFYGKIKLFLPDKGRWEWQERKLHLMRCEVCGLTNRDSKYRRSNQHWEVRKVKRGVMKIRKRRRKRG